MANVELVPFRDTPGDVDAEISRLEADIAFKRARVAESLVELRRRVAGAMSWRQWAREHPAGWVLCGLSLGLVMGIFRSRD